MRFREGEVCRISSVGGADGLKDGSLVKVIMAYDVVPVPHPYIVQLVLGDIVNTDDREGKKAIVAEHELEKLEDTDND